MTSYPSATWPWLLLVLACSVALSAGDGERLARCCDSCHRGDARVRHVRLLARRGARAALASRRLFFDRNSVVGQTVAAAGAWARRGHRRDVSSLPTGCIARQVEACAALIRTAVEDHKIVTSMVRGTRAQSPRAV